MIKNMEKRKLVEIIFNEKEIDNIVTDKKFG